MIDLYYWPTPNGHKISIFLYEAKLPFELKPINIGQGDQFKEEFLRITPNHKIPAIVDHEPSFGKEAISLFESGAILEYLADKTKSFLAEVGSESRYKTLQWVYWQVGGLGPMAGQNHHFRNYASEKIPYAIERYENETNRLYGVLNYQLGNHEYVAGDEYTIADMAIYPWIVPYQQQGQSLTEFPNLQRWFQKIAGREAVKSAYNLADTIKNESVMSEEAKKVLFGQSAKSLAYHKSQE